MGQHRRVLKLSIQLELYLLELKLLLLLLRWIIRLRLELYLLELKCFRNALTKEEIGLELYLLELKYAWALGLFGNRGTWIVPVGIEMYFKRWRCIARGKLELYLLELKLNGKLAIDDANMYLNCTCWNWNLVTSGVSPYQILLELYLLELKYGNVKFCTQSGYDLNCTCWNWNLFLVAAVFASLLTWIVPVGIEINFLNRFWWQNLELELYLLELK